MAENSVSAKTEALDAIVSDFNRKLKAYIDQMQTELGILRSQESILCANWKGDLATNFKAKLDTQIAQIAGSLAKGKELYESLTLLEAKIKKVMANLRAGAQR